MSIFPLPQTATLSSRNGSDPDSRDRKFWPLFLRVKRHRSKEAIEQHSSVHYKTRARAMHETGATERET